jgi:hypothetical protein
VYPRFRKIEEAIDPGTPSSSGALAGYTAKPGKQLGILRNLSVYERVVGGDPRWVNGDSQLVR